MPGVPGVSALGGGAREKNAELGQVDLSSECQAKDFGLYSGFVREGLGQFVLTA